VLCCVSHLQSSVTGTRYPDSKQPARDDTVTVTWATRSTRTATGPSLFRDWPGSVAPSGGGGAVRLQFRSRPQLGVRPHPVLTTYLPCFSNPSRLSQFPPNVKTQCKNNWDLELSFSKFGIYNSQFENLGFRITNVKHWDLELSM